MKVNGSKAIAILVGCVLPLSGCSSAAAPDHGTAVIAIEADPGHFNPAITTAAHVHAVADSLFNGLVALDEEGNPVPDLAESWSVEDEGRAYVFRLASSVFWHDGRPFTSKDVRFTFEEILLRHHARTRSGLETVLAAIETPDESTVIFRFLAPYAPLLSRLDVTEAPILPAHVFEGGGDIERHPANLAPVGTGPFRLRSYTRDDRIELVRNEDYFKPGLPYLDRLVFRVLPDPNTQVLALERGEVDYLSSLPPSEVARLRASEDLEVIAARSGPGGGNCLMTWIFNLDRPGLSELETRRALVRAVDRQEILDKVLFGEGEVAEAPFASGISWAFAPGALRDLDGAVFRPARLSTIDVVHFPSFRKYSELMREQLARVGVDLRIRALERNAAVEVIYRARDFDTALVSYCHGADPEIGIRRMYDSKSVGPVPFSNGAGYRNARVDAMFERASRETDRSVRAALYREIQERVVSDLPYWWLVETRSLAAHRRAFEGFSPRSGQFAERARLTAP